MIEAMVDLETWGIRATSVVRSVGIVVFDGATVLDRHYFRISEQDQYQECHRADGKHYAARTIDKSTMDWWAKPENAAAQEMIEQAPLISWEEARTICGKVGDKVKHVWAKPAGFDLVILRDLFGQDIWPYWKERDLTTLVNEFDHGGMTKPVFQGTKHNALHDAEHAHTWLINLRSVLPHLVLAQEETTGGKIWSCKIGEADSEQVPDATDLPMRNVVAQAYRALTGVEPKFIFSGWGAKLTRIEREVANGK